MSSFNERDKVRVRADYTDPVGNGRSEPLSASQAAGEDGIILVSAMHVGSLHKVSLRNGLRGDFYSWELEKR